MNFSTVGDNFTMLNIHFLYRQIVNNLFMPTTRVCARVRERDDQSSLELRLLLSCTVNSSSLVIFESLHVSGPKWGNSKCALQLS